MQRYVLHVDLDQFIAAVELLRRPELRGRPVIVGGDGDPTKRGVVSTANYEARRYGIGSAMPLRTAYKRCPEAVFLPVDADAYMMASAQVMDALRGFGLVVQVLGWDEAFLAARTDDPVALAREIQRGVRERTQLWCSIGVGDNKLRAKIATSFAKPAGVFMLTEANWWESMGERSTDALWGIGQKTSRKLEALGIRTVSQLARADEAELIRTFGPGTRPWLKQLAAGEGSAEVSAEPHVPRGRGKERTYQQDITNVERIRHEVRRIAGELAVELSQGGRLAVRVVVKVRFAPFFTQTRGLWLPKPTLDPSAIEGAASDALDRFELDRPVRLLGVRVELGPPG